MDWRVAAATVALGLAGCGPGAVAPALRGVEPGWGWTGEPVEIVVRGEAFYPGVEAGGTDGLRVDDGHRLWLEAPGAPRVPLDAVRASDFETLRATVPAGVPVGLWDIVLQRPDGARARLTDGWRSTETRADALQVRADRLRWSVGSVARLQLTLVDPAGDPVPEALPIEVRVEGAPDAGLVWLPSLDGQEPLGGAVGIRGALGADGTAVVALRSDSPASLWVSAGPEDRTSVVDAGSDFVVFDAGVVEAVKVGLLGPADIVAGDPLPVSLSLRDAAGNPTSGLVASLLVRERCGGEGAFSAVVDFVDEGSLVATLTRASGTAACPENGLDVVGIGGGAALVGSSDPVVVRPAAAARLAVDVWPGAVTAGGAPFSVWVEAVDAFGNRTDALSSALLLDAASGALGADEWSCRPPDGGQSVCTAGPRRAADPFVLRARAGALVGESTTLTVAAGPPSQLSLEVPAATVAAGTVFSLGLGAQDAWGNAATLDPLGTDAATFTDGAGPLACAWTGTRAADRVESYACIATFAEPEKRVQATVAARALSALSGPFAVVNGPLASVTVALDTSAIDAGGTLGVALAGADAWGNPALTGAHPTLTVQDGLGELIGLTASLDAAGAATLSPTLTLARAADTLTVRAAGVPIGVSPPFAVRPGAAVGLALSLPARFAWVGAPLAVSVSAVDVYGNPDPSFVGPVRLASAAAAGPEVQVTGFAGGAAATAFRYTAVALGDRLEAAGGGLSGQSLLVDAGMDCGADGPSADVLLDGSGEATFCLVGGSTAPVTVQTGGTLPGVSPIAAVHLQPEDGAWERGAPGDTAWTWSTPGARRVGAWAIDAGGCAAAASALAWVGENDGTPVGPVDVQLASATLVAGSAGLGTTSVTVRATDCAGDPASGSTLFLRADLGALSGLTATGAGLALGLDGRGRGSATLSVSGTAHDGPATVHAGVPGGAAWGAATAAVTGEFALPTVVEVSPEGTVAGAIPAWSVTFDEPMLASSLHAGAVGIADALGNTVSGLSLALDATATTLTLAPPTPLAAGTAWVLTLGANVRDQAGNRLDGTWAGAASPAVLRAGAWPDLAPDALDCAASTPELRPDGDPGLAVEADSATLAVRAGAAPAAWLSTLWDSTGVRCAHTRVAATGATATLAWDGRCADGRVADAGDLLWEVHPLDIAGNRGAPCAALLTVSHPVGPPPEAP